MLKFVGFGLLSVMPVIFLATLMASAVGVLYR